MALIIIRDMPVNICTDCVMLTANGMLGNGDDTADDTHAQKMHDRMEGDEKQLVLDMPGADNNEDTGVYFSVWPCDACGTHWSGDRFPARVLHTVPC